MKIQKAPFVYKWDIWTNNLGYGYRFVKRFNNLHEAKANMNRIQDKYGCCEIVKKRYYIEEV